MRAAAGRARLALAMSLMNVADWPAGQPMPAAHDYAAQEQGQYTVQFAPAGGPSPIQATMDFVEFGRPYIEQAAGGNAAWTEDVNFGLLLAESPYAPELDLHTISDQLVPVQQENYYRHTVAFAGRSDLLRQAFVQRQLHCNLTPSELVAGVQAVGQRVETGRWGHLADPAALNAAAGATGLGSFGAPAFIPYEPGRLSGDNGPFDPFTGGSFPFPFGRW